MARCLTLSLVVIPLFAFVPLSASAQEALVWEDCVRESAQNHPDLISAEESVKQSEAAKAVTASDLWPQITGDAAVSTTAKAGTSTDSYSYGVSGTQLVFDGFKAVQDVKAAAEDLQATKHQYRYKSSQVRYALRSAFVNLLRAQELIRVAEDITKIRRNNLVLITLSYESGLEHQGALLTAQANLAQAQLEEAQARRNLEAAQLELALEMGREQFSPMIARGDLTVNNVYGEKPDLTALAKEHPYFTQLSAKENSAAFSVKAANADFFPDLSARASAGQTGSNWPADDEQWSAGLSLSFPLFEGGLKTAQADKAKAAWRQARADTRSAYGAVVMALENTWTALQDAIQAVDVQKRTLSAAEARSRIAEAQYSVGFISYDNWSIIEDGLVQAKKAYLNAQANALLAEAAWVQAKGDTLEYEK